MPKPSTFPRAPQAIILRLQRQEVAQRRETLKKNLRAEPVSVEGLLLLQRNLCGCGCGEPLDFESPWDPKNPPPGYPCIAHRLSRGSKGEHTAKNVSVDRTACNARDAKVDTSGAASVKRFAVDWFKREVPKSERRPGKIRSRGFDKTKTKRFSGEVVPRMKETT